MVGYDLSSPSGGVEQPNDQQTLAIIADELSTQFETSSSESSARSDSHSNIEDLTSEPDNGEIDEREIKARRAVEHFEHWLRKAHPKLSDAEVLETLTALRNRKILLDYYIDEDDFDEEIMNSRPDLDWWKPWYLRQPR